MERLGIQDPSPWPTTVAPWRCSRGFTWLLAICRAGQGGVQAWHGEINEIKTQVVKSSMLDHVSIYCIIAHVGVTTLVVVVKAKRGLSGMARDMARAMGKLKVDYQYRRVSEEARLGNWIFKKHKKVKSWSQLNFPDLQSSLCKTFLRSLDLECTDVIWCPLSLLSLFQALDSIFIRYSTICKIGADVCVWHPFRTFWVFERSCTEGQGQTWANLIPPRILPGRCHPRPRIVLRDLKEFTWNV